MQVFEDIAALAAVDDEVEVGRGEWRTVTQEMVDTFADATDDHQWIHVDPERAADGPFGTTIAHGFLTLSLLPALVRGMVEVGGAGMVVNVGSNKVRFLAPVPVGARLRAHSVLLVTEPKGDAVRCTYRVTIELEGSDTPAAVVETVNQVFPAAS